MSKTAAKFAALFMILAAVYFTREKTPEADTAGTDTDTDESGIFSGVIGMVKSEASNFAASVVNSLSDPNVMAFLRLIRTGEGTADAAGYSRMFGGAQFFSYADHPRVFTKFGNTTTSAAGAYQFLSRTWDEMAALYKLPDFSPASQDIAAVGLIKRRGALGDVMAGRFKTAILKCNKEWASLPLSPYGQPTLTMSKAAMILAGNGGNSSEVIA